MFKVDQTHWLDGSDLDDISPLHPYYSRDYRSTSHFDQMNPQDAFHVEPCVQIMYSSINKSKICPKWAQATDSMGQIRTAYLLCTRITLETTALRVILDYSKL